MSSIAAAPRLASAAVVLFGRHGAVSRLARRRGVSRQALYRQAHAVVAAVRGSAVRRRLRRLRQRLAQQRGQLADQAQRLRQAVVVDADKRAQFAATAQALGVSLSAARALLAVWLGDRAPSTAQLGRFARDAGRC